MGARRVFPSDWRLWLKYETLDFTSSVRTYKFYSPYSTPINNLLIINHFQLFCTYIPSTLLVLFPILPTTLQVGLLFPYTDLETEAQRVWVTCLRSHTQCSWKAEQGSKPRSLFLQAYSITPWWIPKLRLARWSNPVFGRKKNGGIERRPTCLWKWWPLNLNGVLWGLGRKIFKITEPNSYFNVILNLPRSQSRAAG